MVVLHSAGGPFRENDTLLRPVLVSESASLKKQCLKHGLFIDWVFV